MQMLFACVHVVDKQDYGIILALPVLFVVVALFLHTELRQCPALSPWVVGGVFLRPHTLGVRMQPLETSEAPASCRSPSLSSSPPAGPRVCPWLPVGY